MIFPFRLHDKEISYLCLIWELLFMSNTPNVDRDFYQLFSIVLTTEIRKLIVALFNSQTQMFM